MWAAFVLLLLSHPLHCRHLPSPVGQCPTDLLHTTILHQIIEFSNSIPNIPPVSEEQLEALEQQVTRIADDVNDTIANSELMAECVPYLAVC